MINAKAVLATADTTAVNARSRGTRAIILAALLAIAAMVSLPQSSSAHVRGTPATKITQCGAMTFGIHMFGDVSIRGGSCADARATARGYLKASVTCSTQPTMALLKVTCGAFKGMRARAVAFQNTFANRGGQIRLTFRNRTVTLYPRVMTQALGGKPKAVGGAARGQSLRFGTANGLMGMQSEHEMITRAALSCAESSTVVGVVVKGVEDAVRNCFEPRSIDNLAGYGSWSTVYAGRVISHGSAYTGSGFGAVGAADNMLNRGASGGPDWWHCDGADYLDPSDNAGATYPQDRIAARSRLAWCHDFAQMMMSSKLSGSFAGQCGDSIFYTWRSPCTGLVDMAANLLDANGLAKKGMELTSSCGFDGGQKTSNSYVKCSTLEPFGYVLHAVEDFYSHSNYSDGSDPTKPVGVSNPPGFLPDIPVTAASLPAFWDLSSGTMIDNVNAELFGKGTAWPITGCYPDSSCTNRVLHNNVLTKDLSGGIDYTKGANATIGAPGNPRGATNSNTLRAVRFAILEARRQWEVAQSLLMQRYGEQKGAMMICALTRDNPITCNS